MYAIRSYYGGCPATATTFFPPVRADTSRLTGTNIAAVSAHPI